MVPSDVLPLLRAGTVDTRLFDVTTLIEFGYDDRRDDLPLIVTGARRQRPGRPRRASPVVRTVPGGTAVRLAKKRHRAGLAEPVGGPCARTARPARRDPASKIWLDGLRKPVLKESVPQIGAPTAWAAGFDGTGVKVAVVDTGVDTSHPDLAGRVVAAGELHHVDTDTLDRVGHGTHVAATIAQHRRGPGRLQGRGARRRRCWPAKVCASTTAAPTRAILAGMQWAAEQGAKVVNMSLGGARHARAGPGRGRRRAAHRRVRHAVRDLRRQRPRARAASARRAAPTRR